MPWTLERDDLDALGRGASLLGGGGGGSPRLVSLSAAAAPMWPVAVHAVDEMDPAMPCVAVGVGGSTMVYGERLPGPDLFADAIATVDRWTGSPARAVCLAEIGGMNAFTALPVSHDLHLVDVDLMGRALPALDQLTLLVDDVPRLAIAASVPSGGVLLLADARPVDIEQVLRAAFQVAGGWAGFVIGGFTVGDLVEHGIAGGLRRALSLGRRWSHRRMPIEERVAAIDGRLLAVGRIAAVESDPSDARVRTFDVRADDGAVARVVARTEAVACVIDGVVVARGPDIIDIVDPQTGAVLQLEDVGLGRNVAVLSLEAPEWWTAEPQRLVRVLPSHYGLAGLDEMHA